MMLIIMAAQLLNSNNVSFTERTQKQSVVKNHTHFLCMFESTAFRQAIFNTEEYQV